MTLTKKTHYNPCFWTAFWNHEYFCHDYRDSVSAREQSIYSLNLKGNKILKTKVEKVFYEKKMGLLELKFDDYLLFTEKYFPQEYKRVIKDSDNFFCNYVIDNENFFSAIDDCHADFIRIVISKNNITTTEEKCKVALFIVDIMIRNHKNFERIRTTNKEANRTDADFFWHFREHLTNPKFLLCLASPLIGSKWVIYATQNFKFPLCDTPVLLTNTNLMFALSPKMLIEIDFRKISSPDSRCNIKKNISNIKYREFMRRTIQNTHREIIFGNEDILKKWKESEVYKNRINELL